MSLLEPAEAHAEVGAHRVVSDGAADYFLVRRGSYDVASFFTADGAYLFMVALTPGTVRQMTGRPSRSVRD